MTDPTMFISGDPDAATAFGRATESAAETTETTETTEIDEIDEIAEITEQWIQGYLAAWSSNDPAQIMALFTTDASYRTEPYSDPWVGHQDIVDGWLSIADEPDGFTFDWSPLVLTPELSVVQGTTRYSAGTTYSNLWLIRFAADGRAREFTEWWMDQADSDSDFDSDSDSDSDSESD